MQVGNCFRANKNIFIPNVPHNNLAENYNSAAFYYAKCVVFNQKKG